VNFPFPIVGLAFIESCVQCVGSSFMHVNSKDSLEFIATTLSKELQHIDAPISIKEFVMATLECEEGIICLYYLSNPTANEQGINTDVEQRTIALEPFCLLNIKQQIPLDLYCAKVDWCIMRVVFSRSHIIVCTAKAPALNTYRLVVLRLGTYCHSVSAMTAGGINYLCRLCIQRIILWSQFSLYLKRTPSCA